jgi:P4 family phage/plasmid primase-like protien
MEAVVMSAVSLDLTGPMPPTFAISSFPEPATTSTTPTRRVLTLDQLRTLLGTHERRRDKDGRGWSGATYKPGTTRANANVTEWSVAVGDLDHLTGDDVLELRGRLVDLGLGFILYSTYSSTDTDFCLRVVVPLTKPVAAAQYGQVWHRINATVFGGKNDPQTRDASRMSYLPAAPEGVATIADYVPGLALDWEKLPPAPAPKATAGARSTGQDVGIGRETMQFLLFGADVGHQRGAALSATRSLLAMGKSVEETAAKVWQGLQASRVGDPADPWTYEHALEIAEDLARREPTPLEEWSDIKITGRTERNGHANGATHAETRAAPIEDGGSDKGLTRELADAICAAAHFARGVDTRLFVYQDGAYRPTGDRYVEREVKRLLLEWKRSRSWTSHRVSEVEKYILADAPDLWTRPPLDTLNLTNGLLDVASLDLREHSPAFLSSVQLPAAFDPEAECPAWDAFMIAIFPEDALGLALQLPGWLALPEMRHQKAVLLVGAGGNGKSTYLNSLTGFLGRANVSNVPLHRIEADRFAAAGLVGRLANICADLPSDELVGTSMFKAITGGDPIPAERKFRDAFEFAPFARLIFSTNALPRSKDATSAFFDRWHVIPFERQFRGDSTERDQGEIVAELTAPAELSGLLNRALVVLPLLRSGGLLMPESVRQAGLEMRELTDPLAVWLDKYTVTGGEAFVTKEALLSAYNRANMRTGRPVTTMTGLTQALARLRPSVQVAQRLVAGKMARVWLGLGLNEEGDD